MNIEELQALCQEAARDLAARTDRPLAPAVVLPMRDATRVTSLPDFPDDNDLRFGLLERFAQDVMRPANAPCYGFVAEAVADTPEGAHDVLVVAYGARRHHPRIMAAPIAGSEVGEFSPAEELDPVAMPFLAPLQRAVEDATAPLA